MGAVTSAIVGGIDGIAAGITSVAADVGAVGKALTGLAASFAKTPASHGAITIFALGPHKNHKGIFLGDDPVTNGLAQCQTAAKARVLSNWKIDFPGSSLPQSDFGSVADFTPGGNMTSMINQLTNDFSVWGISLNSTQIQQIANSIVSNVVSTGGQASDLHFVTYISLNQAVNIELTYGTYVFQDNNHANHTYLVYAFAALEVFV